MAAIAANIPDIDAVTIAASTETTSAITVDSRHSAYVRLLSLSCRC